MGEIADMMLDGTLCQCCGTYIGSDNDIPTYCAGCDPKRQPKPQKLKNSGKSTMPFVISCGSKIVHRVNPKTRKSYCQFENNLARGNSAAFNGPPPLEFFERRETYSFKRDCKNCEQLSAKAATP